MLAEENSGGGVGREMGEFSVTRRTREKSSIMGILKPEKNYEVL